jgi:hypothetical protein
MDPLPIPEAICSIVDFVVDFLFAAEVVIRYVVSPKTQWGFSFLVKPFNMIDILAALPISVRVIGLLPGYSELVRTASLLCVIAVLRLLKIMRRFQKIHLLLGAFQLALEALPVLMFVLAILTLTFASMVYLVEPRDNIENFGKAVYFTLVTITSLGYGDIVPTTTEGTFIVVLLVVSSAMYMAMPFGIIGHAFTLVWEDRDRILLIKKTQSALYQWGYTPHDIPMLFSIFDSIGHGELNICDFRKMITAMRIGLSDRRICDLFHSFDKNGDGFVNDRELVRWVFPGSFHEVYSEYGSESHPSQLEDRVPTTSRSCPCGALLHPESLFCSACGLKVGESPALSEIHQNVDSSDLPGTPMLMNIAEVNVDVDAERLWQKVGDSKSKGSSNEDNSPKDIVQHKDTSPKECNSPKAYQPPGHSETLN